MSSFDLMSRELLFVRGTSHSHNTHTDTLELVTRTFSCVREAGC